MFMDEAAFTIQTRSVLGIDSYRVQFDTFCAGIKEANDPAKLTANEGFTVSPLAIVDGADAEGGEGSGLTKDHQHHAPLGRLAVERAAVVSAVVGHDGRDGERPAVPVHRQSPPVAHDRHFAARELSQAALQVTQGQQVTTQPENSARRPCRSHRVNGSLHRQRTQPDGPAGHTGSTGYCAARELS